MAPAPPAKEQQAAVAATSSRKRGATASKQAAFTARMTPPTTRRAPKKSVVVEIGSVSPVGISVGGYTLRRNRKSDATAGSAKFSAKPKREWHAQTRRAPLIHVKATKKGKERAEASGARPTSMGEGRAAGGSSPAPTFDGAEDNAASLAQAFNGAASDAGSAFLSAQMFPHMEVR